MCRTTRYEEAGRAYEEGLRVCPGDEALGRGLEDVLRAQKAARSSAGENGIADRERWFLDIPTRTVGRGC